MLSTQYYIGSYWDDKKQEHFEVSQKKHLTEELIFVDSNIWQNK